MDSKQLATTASTPARASDTEKITINLGLVDLGQIDLLVQEGFYSNRTDLIRTAIRNHLATHAETVRQTVGRKAMLLGPRGLHARRPRSGEEVREAHSDTGTGARPHCTRRPGRVGAGDDRIGVGARRLPRDARGEGRIGRSHSLRTENILSESMNSTLREAMRLMQTGDLLAATAEIQRGLGGGPAHAPHAPPGAATEAGAPLEGVFHVLDETPQPVPEPGAEIPPGHADAPAWTSIICRAFVQRARWNAALQALRSKRLSRPAAAAGGDAPWMHADPRRLRDGHAHECRGGSERMLRRISRAVAAGERVEVLELVQARRPVSRWG